MKAKKTKRAGKASAFLKKRYIKNDEKRLASLETERVNAYVATQIHDMRKAAGLSQAQLADLADTTQSVISRLEDSDYDGHSIKMLERIAQVLNARVKVDLVKVDSEPQKKVGRG